MTNATPEEFCLGAELLAPLLEETYKYNYDEKPNYNKLRELLGHKNGEIIIT